MNISQALKRIDDESIQVLRRSVRVDFDHSREKPKAFYINHQIHEIVSAVGPFAGDLTEMDVLQLDFENIHNIIKLCFHDGSLSLRIEAVSS